MKHSLNREKTFPEIFFLFMIIIFGVISTFITYPLTNGDEGYHLSRSYTIFSKNNPESMKTETVRNLELTAISSNKKENDFDVGSFFKTKLSDVEDDNLGFHFQREDNSILKIGIGHIPSAIGVLIGRFIYPSYGVMLVFSRLANLIFFAICLFFIIKSSMIGKWSLVMLFSVPFIQKIASPSYDVYSYVVISAFMVNLLNLAKFSTFKAIPKKQISYTIITMVLILFAKNNYIFALPSILFLPVISNEIIAFFKRQNKGTRIVSWILILVFSTILLYFSNKIFHLDNFAKQFINSYLNVETMGRRGRTLFSVVSTILPDIFNLLWMLCLLFVMLTERKFGWSRTFITGLITIFFINWIGIYAGFYLILNKPVQVFDELSGRYLHPFIICFLPFTQRISYKYDLVSSEKAVRNVAITSSLIIMIAYLIVCYYRGFLIHTTPTWTTR